MDTLWTKERVGKGRVHHHGHVNGLYLGYIAVIYYPKDDSTIWIEAFPKFGKNKNKGIFCKSLELAKEHIIWCAEEAISSEKKNDMIVDLREPEYRCEICFEEYNKFRRRNRNGRCKCGGEIVRRYPYVG